MVLYTLKREQHFERPLREVFSFFSKPENLVLITPKKLAFNILTPTPISMRDGALVDYTINLRGLRVRWTTIIAHYDPPHSFVDVQLRGPYAYWHHTHSFTEVKGGTLMTDEVRYALPFGPIGAIAHDLWVRRELMKIFEYRRRVLAERFKPAAPRKPRKPANRVLQEMS
jgi:hypothetical protein